MAGEGQNIQFVDHETFQKFLNVWESRVDGILLGTMEYLGRSGGHA